MLRVMLALGVVAAAVVLAGCGGEKSKPTTGPSALQTLPSAHGTTSPRRTGIESVDKVIAAVEANDIETLISLVRFTDMPCTSTQPTSIPIVRCPTGEPDGSPVHALLSASCEGTWMEAAEGGTEAIRSSAGAANANVYAVYRPARARFEDFPAVTYATVLTYPLNGQTAGLALLLDDEGIVGYDIDCGFPPEQMAKEHFGEVILPPQ